MFIWEVSLTHPMLPFFFFLSVGSFSYTSRAGFISMQGVSLTHPELASFLCGEFFLHIPCCFKKNNNNNNIWGVSLTHFVLALFLSGEFLLHIPCLLFLFFSFSVGSFSYTSRAGFIYMQGVSLTHPELASFLCGEFLLHIPCCFKKKKLGVFL